MKLLGVILSGGKSSRMGTDKGLLEFKGKAMIEYSIDLLKPLCESLIISSNDKSYEKFGLPLVADVVQEIGPIGGIFSAMNEIKADYYFVVSCDMPLASKSFAKILVSNIGSKEVIVPCHSGGKVEPLFAIYSFSVLNKMKKQIELKNYKLMNLLEECETNYLDVPVELFKESPGMFKNVNTLKDID